MAFRRWTLQHPTEHNPEVSISRSEQLVETLHKIPIYYPGMYCTISRLEIPIHLHRQDQPLDAILLRRALAAIPLLAREAPAHT